MTPLVSMASGVSARGYGLFKVNGAAATSYESIATVTVGAGGSSSITFSSIPSTYKHLQIRCLARTDRAAVTDFAKVQFNSDTATNYSIHGLEGDGATPTAYGVANQDNVNIYRFAGANATSSVFGVSIVDILEYANANIYKTVRDLGGADNNGSGVLGLTSGNWRSTSVISSIQIKPGLGTNFVQYSTFALYGVKG